MTGRERLLKTLRGERTDRVPVSLFILDQGEFISQVYPDVAPWDCETNQCKIIEFSKAMGVDVFLRVLFTIDDPDFAQFGVLGGLNVAHETDTWRLRHQCSRQGATETIATTITTPAGTLTQEFSIAEARPGTFLYSCTKKPIENPDDLVIAAQYEPGLPPAWKEKIRAKFRRLKETLGDAGILGAWAPWGAFNNASYITGVAELHTLFLDAPQYYHDLMQFCLARPREYVDILIESGVDVLCIGGNVPGGFMGKENYDQYVLPYEKQCVKFAQRNGTPAIYHNCGQIMSLVESYKDLGVCVVEPFSPPPLGDAGLAEAKSRSAGAYVMLSGLDQVNVLRKGSVDDVKKAAKAAMETGKRGGGFIMQNVDYLDYGTPLENIEAYVDMSLQHAEYGPS